MAAPPKVKKVLVAVGAVKVWAVPIKPNLLRCSVFEPTAPLNQNIVVVDGVLQSPTGGLAEEAAGRRSRVIAVPGPLCTLADVAEATLPLFQSADPAAPLSLEAVTLAIFAYNQAILTPGSPIDPNAAVVDPPFPQWRVGMHLTLPLEINVANAVLVTELAKLRGWAGTYDDWTDLVGSEEAEPLPIPDPFQLQAEVAAAIPAAGAFDRDAFADALRARLLTNCFEPVFFFYEAVRQLRQNRPGDVLPILLRFFDSLAEHHALLLGALSAGNAVLRRCWTLLEEAAAAGVSAADEPRLLAARRRVATALGLQADPTVVDRWASPQECSPTFAPVEPALVPAAGIRKVAVPGRKNPQNRIAAMTLGRVVDVSEATDTQVKAGVAGGKLSFVGEPPYVALTWLAARAAAATPGIEVELSPPTAAKPPGGAVTAPRVKSRMSLAARIAGNEGNLDSTQAGDKGIVSYGMQQWAAHSDAEFSVLLERFRVQAPDLYDLCIGMWGLQTERWASGIKPADPPDAAGWAARKQKIDRANPFGSDPDDPANPLTDAGKLGYFPSNVCFFVMDPAATPGQPRSARRKHLPAPPFGKPGPRVDFFTAGPNAVSWSGRVRLAALISVEFNRVQVHQAAWRLTRLDTNELHDPVTDPADGRPTYKLKTYQVPVHGEIRAADERPATPATLEYNVHQLFPSSFAAAAVLNHHINVGPPTVVNSIQDAIDRTPGPTHVLVQETPLTYALDDAWLRRFAVNYLGGRTLPPDNARNRNSYLLSLHDRPLPKGLSPDPGTFDGW